MKSKKTSKKSVTRKTHPHNSGLVSACVFGAGVGIAATVALLVFCSMICLFSRDPNKTIAPMAFISLVVVYFITGFSSAKRKCAAIPCGVLSGGIITVIFFVISFFVEKNLSSGYSLIIELMIRLSLVVVSIIGALLGTNSKVRKRIS